jgi:hypothetical protein
MAAAKTAVLLLKDTGLIMDDGEDEHGQRSSGEVIVNAILESAESCLPVNTIYYGWLSTLGS